MARTRRVTSVRTMRIRSAARSRLLVAAGALLTAIGLTAGTALPAVACPPPVTTYVALGDSYAAGQLVPAQGALNATISGAVAAVAAGGVHVQYVDVQFTGHTVDSADPWFFLTGPNVFHPTPPGDQAFAVALAAAL